MKPKGKKNNRYTSHDDVKEKEISKLTDLVSEAHKILQNRKLMQSNQQMRKQEHNSQYEMFIQAASNI